VNKYFAYKGSLSLKEAKDLKIDNTKLHLNSNEIAIRRCDRIWGKDNYKIYIFEDFNKNSTFKEIK
jgi:hypothetical protein